jgi:hypothetical protein
MARSGLVHSYSELGESIPTYGPGQMAPTIDRTASVAAEKTLDVAVQVR